MLPSCESLLIQRRNRTEQCVVYLGGSSVSLIALQSHASRLSIHCIGRPQASKSFVELYTVGLVMIQCKMQSYQCSTHSQFDAADKESRCIFQKVKEAVLGFQNPRPLSQVCHCNSLDSLGASKARQSKAVVAAIPIIHCACTAHRVQCL